MLFPMRFYETQNNPDHHPFDIRMDFYFEYIQLDWNYVADFKSTSRSQINFRLLDRMMDETKESGKFFPKGGESQVYEWNFPKNRNNLFIS